MIKITEQQLKTMENRTTEEFLYRAIDIMQDDIAELIAHYKDQELYEFLCLVLKDARSYHIEVEHDVYDFMTLSLANELAFLTTPPFVHKIEWFRSPYVPSVKKIQEINRLLANTNKAEAENVG